MKRNSGVYRIRNTKTGHCYIGSSTALKRRRIQHFSALRAGQHPNRNLQAAFDKYGAEALVFEVIEYISGDEERCQEREEALIETAHPEYNLASSARGSRGYSHTPEAIEKIREASERRWARKGEHARARQAQQESPRAQAARERLHANNVGTRRNMETRQKMRAAAQARREQTAEIMRQKWADPAFREKVMAARQAARSARQTGESSNA